MRTRKRETMKVRQINVRWPAPEQLVAHHAELLTILDNTVLLIIALLGLCVSCGVWYMTR